MLDNRWFILAVLVVARLALAFQFQAAGSAAPFLADAFGLDYTAIGLLVGLFMLPGLALSLPAGAWGRRFGDKTVVLAGFALMLAGSLLCAVAPDFATLLAGRLVVGAGAVFLWVLLTKMLTDWFAERDLYLGMSIFIVMWPVGIAAAQVSQPALSASRGWSASFLIAAAVGAAAFALVAAFYRPPPRGTGAAPGDARLSRREFRLICIVGANWLAINAAYLVMLTFGPALLVERGVGAVRAATVASTMSWVFLVALPAGGLIAGRVRSPDALMIGGLATAAALGATLPATPAPALSFALYGIAFGLATAVIAALPAQLLRPETRGSGLGLYYLWFFAGLPPLVAAGGWLADLAGSAVAAMWYAAALLVANIALILWARRVQARPAAAG